MDEAALLLPAGLPSAADRQPTVKPTAAQSIPTDDGQLGGGPESRAPPEARRNAGRGVGGVDGDEVHRAKRGSVLERPELGAIAARTPPAEAQLQPR